jgi:hypothetical protein
MLLKRPALTCRYVEAYASSLLPESQRHLFRFDHSIISTTIIAYGLVRLNNPFPRCCVESEAFWYWSHASPDRHALYSSYLQFRIHRSYRPAILHISAHPAYATGRDSHTGVTTWLRANTISNYQAIVCWQNAGISEDRNPKADPDSLHRAKVGEVAQLGSSRLTSVSRSLSHHHTEPWSACRCLLLSLSLSLPPAVYCSRTVSVFSP